MRVLETAGVAYIVSANGVPVPLSETEVTQVRECFSRNLDVEPCEYLPGTRVRVTSGPLTGLEGVIVRQNGKARFIISVDLIMRSVAVSVEAADVEAVTEVRSRAA